MNFSVFLFKNAIHEWWMKKYKHKCKSKCIANPADKKKSYMLHDINIKMMGKTETKAAYKHFTGIRCCSHIETR